MFLKPKFHSSIAKNDIVDPEKFNHEQYNS